MSDCPIPTCQTCGRAPEPLDQGPVGLVFWWLLDCFPEVWAERSSHTRLLAAQRIARLRERARRERSVAP